MNMMFLLGFGAALLVGTKDGQNIIGKVTTSIGGITEKGIKVGRDILKEAMPDTAKILGVGKNDISTEADKVQ